MTRQNNVKLFEKKNLRLNSKKCEFHKNKIIYLKFVIEYNQIRLNSIKIKTIKKKTINQYEKNTNLFKICQL